MFSFLKVNNDESNKGDPDEITVENQNLGVFLEQKKRNKIFFVCTSNTCRSPMAEGIARKFAKENQLPIEVGSFGLWTCCGSEPSSNGVSICESENIDISNQRSTSMRYIDFQEFENVLCVCMADWHAKGILREKNNSKLSKGNIILLDPEGRDIPDPIGRDPNRYRRVFDKIKPLVEQRVKEFATKVCNEEQN